MKWENWWSRLADWEKVMLIVVCVTAVAGLYFITTGRSWEAYVFVIGGIITGTLWLCFGRFGKHGAEDGLGEEPESGMPTC